MAGFAIKVGADTRPFEQGMKAAVGVGAQTAAQIGAKWAATAAGIDRAMMQTARNVGVSFGREVASRIAPAALGIVGAFAAFQTAKLAVDALGAAAREAGLQLDRMAQIGADASRLGVSSTFLQTYRAQARALKVDADSLVKSLETARAAFAVRQGEGGENARNDSTFGARLREQMAAGNLSAAQVSRFDSAIGTEAQFKAALDIMAEMQAKGRDLAALDLAGKLFPPETVDRIRSGNLELAQFRKMIDDVKNPDLVLLKPDEIVRAQELQRRLQEAQATMDRAATEFRHELAQAGVGLREDAIAWKELMASGARIAVTILQQARQIREEMTANEPAVFGRDYWREEDRPASGLKKDIGRTTRATSTGDVERDAALDRLRGNLGNRTLIEQAQEASRRMSEGLRPDQTKPIVTARPKGGGGGAASPSESFNAVETYINGIERSTEALKAETAALGMAGGERLSAINLAKLEATARQQGITLTEAQITKVRELSIATDDFKTKIEESHEAQNAIRAIGGDIFRGIANDARNGASAIDLITNATDRLAARLSDRAMDSLANSLFGKPGSGESGSIGSFFTSFLPKFADGTILNGPGTGTSDSMLARVSTGEAIIPARVVTANRPLVEALVRDRLPRFADGRLPDAQEFSSTLNAAAAARPYLAPHFEAPRTAGPAPASPVAVTINNNAPVNVQAQEVPDGRGGRRLEVQIDEMTAGALNRPGSQSHAAARRNPIASR